MALVQCNTRFSLGAAANFLNEAETFGNARGGAPKTIRGSRGSSQLELRVSCASCALSEVPPATARRCAVSGSGLLAAERTIPEEVFKICQEWSRF
jgi:hypothetical protein